MEPYQCTESRLTQVFRLPEIYAVLGYDLPDLPTSVEATYKVNYARGIAAQNALELEVSTPNSFVSGRTHLSFFANLMVNELGPANKRLFPAHRETGNRSTIACSEQSLSSLICAIGTIPKFMLERALSPQNRWGEYGVEYQVDLQNARFGTHLKNVFLDSSKLWQSLKHSISLVVVGAERSDSIEFYICGSASVERLYHQQKSYWIEQALWLYCYISPRNPTTL